MRSKAWSRWLAAGGPWQGWSVCPLLGAPYLNGVTQVPPRAARVVVALTDKLAALLEDAAGTALALNLEAGVGVEIAARLNQRGLAHPVLVLPQWPYAEAVLPVDGLLACLVVESRRLNTTRERMPNLVLVLDADRDVPIRRRSARDPRTDNRYRLSAADLPSLADLREGGIRRVVKVSSV